MSLDYMPALKEFPDYIPWIREDAQAVRVNMRPRFDADVSGIAIPLTPAPDHYIVYVSCDWFPAIIWRKFNKNNQDWAMWKVHASRVTSIQNIQFRMDSYGMFHYEHLGGRSIFFHDLFPYVEGWWTVEDDYVKSIRSWTLNGYYVKDTAMPVCYHTQRDPVPPLFAYQDCQPLPGAKALERRMKLVIPDWQPDFSSAGLQYREDRPDATRDDVETAASEFCEGYDYRDFMGNRIEPSQKAVTWLYTVFCAAAGYLV